MRKLTPGRGEASGAPIPPLVKLQVPPPASRSKVGGTRGCTRGPARGDCLGSLSTARRRPQLARGPAETLLQKENRKSRPVGDRAGSPSFRRVRASRDGPPSTPQPWRPGSQSENPDGPGDRNIRLPRVRLGSDPAVHASHRSPALSVRALGDLCPWAHAGSVTPEGGSPPPRRPSPPTAESSPPRGSQRRLHSRARS